MTAVKCQEKNMHIIGHPECKDTCLGTCYIYSTLGAIEALVNLYFILVGSGLDLSEQQILDCKDACFCDKNGYIPLPVVMLNFME